MNFYFLKKKEYKVECNFYIDICYITIKEIIWKKRKFKIQTKYKSFVYKNKINSNKNINWNDSINYLIEYNYIHKNKSYDAIYVKTKEREHVLPY